MRDFGAIGFLVAVSAFVVACNGAPASVDVSSPEVLSPGPAGRGAEETTFPRGIGSRFGLTQIYQQNTHGGLSTSEREGRYAGSYALEVQADLEAQAGIAGAGLYLLVEGGWPDVGSIGPEGVGSRFGVNADAVEGQWGELSELWFERSVVARSLLVRMGKLDLGGPFQCRGCEAAFDGNKYANDETAQFLNEALVNNPTIPFPDRTLGFAAFASPRQDWHFGVAVAARDADDEGNSEVAWGSLDNGAFAVLEGSFVPEGNQKNGHAAQQYRAGLWWATDGDGGLPDDEQRGMYLSVSQPVLYENDGPHGGTGLSLFARAGWADGPGAELDNFWSLGLQYQGLWDSRGADVLGLGVARGDFVQTASGDIPTGSETVWELYYNTAVTSSIAVTPSVQYVANPGGEDGPADALVIGLRLQLLLE